MLYFAYGSNLDKDAMSNRCPAAVPLGRAVLSHHRRVFRPWADVEPHPGSRVAGGLWRITSACLATLDDYEEVEASLYRRVLLDVAFGGRSVEALFYRMTATTSAPPDEGYLASILKGCRDFGLEEACVLAAAVAASV